MTLLGLVFGCLAAGTLAFLPVRLLRIPPELSGELLHALLLLTLSMPIVTSMAGLRGSLEGAHRFDLVNAIRVPTGILNFLAPLMVLPFSNHLGPVVGALVVVRVAAWLAHFYCMLEVFPGLRRGISFSRKVVRPLLSLGSWMTVAGVVSPLMVSLDRFVIGACIGASAVAYYATPFEVITKLWLIPGSIAAVLFPAFSAAHSVDKDRVVQFFERGSLAILYLTGPFVLVAATLARELLQLWLGREFALNSTFVLQWLAVGVFINSLGYVPSVYLQGVGRADLLAKLQVFELPIYGVMLYFSIQRFGIKGAALAWVFRVAMDTGVQFWLSRRLAFELSRPIKGIVFNGFLIIAMSAVGSIIPTPTAKIIYLLISVPIVCLLAWKHMKIKDMSELFRRQSPELVEI